jgi:uncharacterized protein YdaU (DUF1376 family)
MGKDPAFLFYTSDFLTGTMFMTNEQVGLYIRLLCAQHQHGGRIDTNVLRTQCDSITGGDTVFSKFTHDHTGSYNERLAEEIEKRKDKSVKASESVKKRWNKVESSSYDSNTNVLRSENENEDVNESEVVTEKGIARIEKKETAIAPRNVPHETIHAYFSEIGFPNEAAKFIDYYAANGWKVGRNAMKDWQATARNWCRRAQPEAGKQMLNRKQTMNDAREIFNEAAALIDANRNQNP